MSAAKKETRKKFVAAVFARDNYTCRGCGATHKELQLDAHHITNRNEFPNGGYVVENGITLCVFCHKAAERACKTLESSDPSSTLPLLHPSRLYSIIGSSLSKAKDAELIRVLNDSSRERHSM